MQVRQSTARTIIVGPILDADGVAKTDEVVASIKIHKNGAAAAALNASATLTHSQTGFYLLALTASDTDTLGVAEFSLNSGTNSMPVKSVNVLTALAWDALHHASDGILRANVTQLGADTQSAEDLKDFADAGYDPATNKVQGVVLVDTTTTNTDMRGTDNAALAATALSTVTWTGTLATNIGTTNSTVAANLNATITSRMASYTQPTGFLAATFPTTVASTTNITAASGVALSSAGNTAVATAVEAAILNEGDATALLAAIAAKIETFLINEGDATATLAAIATAVRTNLATELGRIDVAISSRNSTAPDNTQGAAVITALGNGTVVLHSDYDAAKDAASQYTADADHDLTQAAIANLNVGAGSGPSVVTIAVVDQDDDPIEGVSVRLTDFATRNYVSTTDADGVIDPLIGAEDATYSLVLSKDGYDNLVTALVVSGDTSPVAYVLTLTVVSPASNPAKSTLTVTCYDEFGNIEPGAIVSIQFAVIPSGDNARSYDKKPAEAIADGSGVAAFDGGDGSGGVVRLARYHVWRGSGPKSLISIPDAATCTVTSFLGREIE